MMREWDEHTLAYAAGFLDGEGCFVIDKQWKICITCSNTDINVIQWFKKKFGGSVARNYRPRKPHHRPIYTWQIVGAQAEDFLRSITPYLLVKAPQGLLQIALQQSKRAKPTKGSRLTPEIIEERSFYKNLITELKRVPGP